MEVRGEVSPRPSHQLTILQPPQVPKTSDQRPWWWLQLARTPPSCSVESDIVVVQLHLVLMTETSSSPGGALPLDPPRVPGFARAYNFELREARPGAIWSWDQKLKVGDLSLTCPAPLQLTTFFEESSGQKVIKEFVDFAIGRNFREAIWKIWTNLD